MGISQLLRARARAAPQIYAYGYEMSGIEASPLIHLVGSISRDKSPRSASDQGLHKPKGKICLTAPAVPLGCLLL